MIVGNKLPPTLNSMCSRGTLMTTKISRRLLAVATGFLATAALATAPARAD